MKVARIEVQTCADCPHVIFARPSVCTAIEGVIREIEDTLEIPDWCPLPDAPEKEV